MKKSRYRTVFNLYSKFIMAFLILIFICLGIVEYLLKISTSNENSYVNWSSEPLSFTTDFSKRIYFKDGKPQLMDLGIKELKKYKLHYQIVDKNGNVAGEYNMPYGSSQHYAPIQMVQLYKNGDGQGKYTMFVGGIDNNGEKWTYIIGFPAKISKITMYLNYDKTSQIKFILLGIMVLIILFIAFFGLRMNRTLLNIISGIRKLASNSYTPMKEKGIYKDVYESLNIVDNMLKTTEIERKRTQTLREEWIANISHDLKTPLSPIKGYAELLADTEYVVTSEDTKKYGTIILRNVKSVETIVENLNFTYQLKNGMVPLNMKHGNLVRLVKEIIINILNNPEYQERNIMFNCTGDMVNFNFDSTLLQRAFTNLLYNSIIHNSNDTLIKVSIKEEDKIYIIIEDNGKGIEEEDLKNIFERYYRGTNSDLTVKGSGLGMAIARQIIEAHKGKISVHSELKIGTRINIEFPKET